MYDADISCIVCTWKFYIHYIELTTSKDDVTIILYVIVIEYARGLLLKYNP